MKIPYDHRIDEWLFLNSIDPDRVDRAYWVYQTGHQILVRLFPPSLPKNSNHPDWWIKPKESTDYQFDVLVPWGES